ncbi:MAG: terminase small subunit [Candidatus Paceibacterota bacterium]|jgi:phage terminase small subunit
MLTKKQMAFVEHYVESLNASDAARHAGYSYRTAGVIGHENLRKPEVAEEIERRLDQGKARREIRAVVAARVKVYLILAENGLVKIGKTIDVERRFQSLNSMSPVDLKLVYVFDTLFGDELEEDLHARYETKRVKGEWFALTEKDVDEIISCYGQPN